ncbi:hypothetical protein GGG16DRAFT_110098 [Schizophyllum commune]
MYDAVGHPTVAYSGCNLSGISKFGQVPDSNLRQLIDSDRPQKKVYLHGHSKMYHLVFSDGYEQDGTFHYPRDNHEHSFPAPSFAAHPAPADGLHNRALRAAA